VTRRCARIQQVFDDNYRVYGARKVWRALLRDGELVARCTVEQLMRRLGICAGQVVSGLLLLLGKEWPRMLGLSVLWFGIAAGTLIMVATTSSCAGLFGIAVDAILIWMLFWAEVRDWCY
jgi:transposase InsO family protein